MDIDLTISDLRKYGYSILRKCFDPEAIRELAKVVDELYLKFPGYHVEPKQLREVGAPPFHSYVFRPHHLALLNQFLGKWKVSESTATRRVGPKDVTHFPGLSAHIDAFFHPFDLTLNFWTPFQICGDGVTPGLSVWATPLDEIASVVGLSQDVRPSVEWNFGHFSSRWYSIANGRETYDLDRRVSPRFEPGDVCLLTNWTIHATGPGDPRARRTNVELRFQKVEEE
jgi:hypothetical protein